MITTTARFGAVGVWEAMISARSCWLAQWSEWDPATTGADRQESGEEKAERILREGLKRLGRERDELAERRNAVRAKVKLAKQLRQETAMTLRWIAQRLEMGS